MYARGDHGTFNPNVVVRCPLQVLNTHVSSEKAGPQQNMAVDHRDLWTTSGSKPVIYIYSDTPVGQNLNICQFLTAVLMAKEQDVFRWISQ